MDLTNAPSEYAFKAELLQWRPGVYLWFRGDQCLYAGQSNHVFLRLLNHHVIQPDQIQADDTIHIVEIESVETRLDLEAALIRKYKPLYNRKAGISRSKSQPKNKLPPEMAKQITERAMLLKEKGYSVGAVAKDLKVAHCTADRLTRGHVLNWRKNSFGDKEAHQRSERDREIIRLYAQGIGVTKISKEFPLSKQRIWQICKLAGLVDSSKLEESGD